MVTAQTNTSHVDQKTSLQPQQDVAQYSPAKDSDLFEFDATIVFGQGPIKPILLPHEVTLQQLEASNNFKKDPHRYSEPNFFLMEQHRYLAQLHKIDQQSNLSAAEKLRLKEARRQEWQKMGWFALKQWGRQNALAAGCALYTGLTKEVILTGGRTMCRWARETLPEERIMNWPSEAELMLDIIKRYYGDLYKKRYGRDIQTVIHLEDKAMTTLENFSYSIKRHPDVLKENKRIGLLSSRHHIKRVSILAQIFSIKHTDDGRLSAQELLLNRREALEEVSSDDHDILECVRLCQESKLAQEVVKKEENSIRGLMEPEYLTYWFGYLADVNNPKVIQRAMRRFEDPQWCEVASSVFEQIGLNVHDYRKEDLSELLQKNPEKYFVLIEGLKKLKKPEYRKFPSRTV